MTWGKARREPAVPAVPAGGIQGVCRMAGPTGLTDGLLGLFPSWDLPLPPAGQKHHRDGMGILDLDDLLEACRSGPEPRL